MASSLSTLVYGKTIAKMLNGDHPWDTQSWRASLLLSTDASTKESEFRSSCTEANGQTAQTVTAIAASAASATVTLDISDATVTFSGVTGSQTISAMLIYANVGSAASDSVLVRLQFTGTDITSDGTNNIVITPGASGIMNGSY